MDNKSTRSIPGCVTRMLISVNTSAVIDEHISTTLYIILWMKQHEQKCHLCFKVWLSLMVYLYCMNCVGIWPLFWIRNKVQYINYHTPQWYQFMDSGKIVGASLCLPGVGYQYWLERNSQKKSSELAELNVDNSTSTIKWSWSKARNCLNSVSWVQI